MDRLKHLKYVDSKLAGVATWPLRTSWHKLNSEGKYERGDMIESAEVEGEGRGRWPSRGGRGWNDTLLRYELRHSLRNTANRFQVYALITRVEQAAREGESM